MESAWNHSEEYTENQIVVNVVNRYYYSDGAL